MAAPASAPWPASRRRARSLVDVPRLVTRLLHRRPDPAVAGAARRVRHLGPSRHRRSSAASTSGTCSRSRQAICELPRSSRASTVRSSSASTRTRCRRRRCASALEVLAANGVDVMLAERRRVHADAGGLARDPHATTAAARAGSPTASSSRPRTTRPTTAASSTTRRTAARPTPTSPAGSRTRANELLEDGAARRQARCRYEQALRAPTTHRHDYPRRLRRRSRQRHRHGRDPRRRAPHRASIRSAAPACTTGRAIAERYRLDLTVVSDEVDPTFRFMTRRLGRPDPHGPVVAVRDAAADRAEGSLRHRLRLRHRPRPPRHRHAAAPACCRPTTISRSPIDYLFRHRPAVARARRRRQDRGQQRA